MVVLANTAGAADDVIVIPDNPKLTQGLIDKAVSAARKGGHGNKRLFVSTVAYADTKAIFNRSMLSKVEGNGVGKGVPPMYFIRVEPSSEGGCLISVRPDNSDIGAVRCADRTWDYGRILHTAYGYY